MRPRHLIARRVGVTSTFLALTVLAVAAAGVFDPEPPLLLTVGSDAACTHATLQGALNQAKAVGPGNDVIWVSQNHVDSSISAEILAHSVTVIGGFTSCSAFSPSGRTTLDGTGGAAASVLWIHGGSADDQHVVHLRNLVIRGGEDDGFGGGLDISGGMNVRLENTAVEENASNLGGGASVRGSDASLVIAEGSEFLNNEASGSGGGIYCEAGFAGLFESAVAFNEADEGGGVAVDQGCLLRHQAGGVLKGIFLNTAARGAGIHAQGGSKVELTGTSDEPAKVVSNNASQSGGGIRVHRAEVRAKNAAIDSNTAFSGAGVSVGIEGKFFMERLATCQPGARCSTLSGNVASSRGGALSVNSGSGLADVRQSYVDGNSAALEGSVAYVTVFGRLVMEGVVLAGNQGGESVIKLRGDTTGRLAFLTVTENQASDAIVVTRDSTFGDAAGLEIYSSIFWESPGTDILSSSAGTPVEVDCLLVHETASLPAGDFITVQPPLFADPGAGDYRLALASPAVDYCDGAAYTPTHRDVAGQQRGVDRLDVADNFLISWYDIGAFEHPLPAHLFSDGFESGDTGAWSP